MKISNMSYEDIMKLEKHSHTRRYRLRGGASEKYYIQCKQSGFEHLDPMDVNLERAIVKAVIHDGVVCNNAHVVAKIGTSSTIQKEWDMGLLLQKKIPGFIKYICTMNCPDNVHRLEHDNVSSFCMQKESDPSKHILIMPYMSGGSMREFEWMNNIDKFKSCFKQLICSLVNAFEQHGFLHSDIHLGNVLLRETKKNTIHYEDIGICIPSNGVQICIMDFEHAFIGVSKTCTQDFYKDINHVLGDIMYTLKLEFEGFAEISNLVTKGCFTFMPVRDVLRLLPMIDSMKFQGKTKPIITCKYDPTWTF